MAELSGLERAERAMEQWRASYAKPKKQQLPDEAASREELFNPDEIEKGFCRRAVNAVRCRKCSANRGEYCRQIDGHLRHAVVFLHNVRRHDYLDLIQETPDSPSPIRNSPVVASTVFIVPVNKQAAWVVSKGSQWQRSGGSWRGIGPLRTRPVPDDMPSMLGVLNGDLLCVGLSAHHAGKNRKGGAAVWICRCVCGYYVTRSTRALRTTERGEFDRLCCDVCYERVRLKKLQIFNETGLWPDQIEAGQERHSQPRG